MGGTMIFDWVLFAILVFLTIVFLMGRGKRILELFDGNRVRKKTDPETTKRYLRSCGVFTGVLSVASLLMALFNRFPVIIFISIGIVIVDLIGLILWIKKHFPNG